MMVLVNCYDSKGNFVGALNLWTDLSKKKIFFRSPYEESGVIGTAEINLQSLSESANKEVAE